MLEKWLTFGEFFPVGLPLLPQLFIHNLRLIRPDRRPDFSLRRVQLGGVLEELGILTMAVAKGRKRAAGLLLEGSAVGKLRSRG